MALSPQATRGFRELIEKTAKEALSQGLTGIAVLVDELQDADEEGLRTIAYAWQELQGSRTPALFVAAGLSHTADVVTAAVTSAERFQFRTMRDLEEHEVREALTEPAAHLGVRWETPALQEVVQRTQGYPYAVQLWGDAMWLASGSPDREGSSALRVSTQHRHRSTKTCRRCTAPGGRKHHPESARSSP